MNLIKFIVGGGVLPTPEINSGRRYKALTCASIPINSLSSERGLWRDKEVTPYG